MINSDVVVAEKFTKIISKSIRFFRVAIKVMVLPEPGGPHIIKGLCSRIQLHKTS